MNPRMSVPTIEAVEFVDLQPTDINPLMSKGAVKVFYIGQNRNGSAIDKQGATKMSKTLRGCPIVGQYIKDKEDFGDHGDQVIIDGQGIRFNVLTIPYGFVSPDAKVWLQFFEDTDEFGNICVREYLCAECYLWTGQFPECDRVFKENNPQSMELDEQTLDGHWATDNNRGIEFFIINDAIFSKLCILGEDVEPCFEGASFISPEFSKADNEFVKKLFTMAKELKFALSSNKGGTLMANLDNGVKETSFKNQDTIETPVTNFDDAGAGEGSTEPVGDGNTPAEGGENVPAASEEQNTQTNDEQQNTNNSEQQEQQTTEPVVPEETEKPTSTEPTVVDGVTLNATDEAIVDNLTDSYAPEGETVAEALVKDGATNVPGNVIQNSLKKDNEEQDKNGKSNTDNSDNNSEGEDSKDTEDDKDKKPKGKCSLEEQYAELQIQFAALQQRNAELLAFKQEVENKEKDELIASFYMLSDEDKKDVIENKAKYSLKEIKAELSMICVDKKVNFSLDNNDASQKEVPTTYNLNSHQADTLPAWLRAVEDTRNKNM